VTDKFQNELKNLIKEFNFNGHKKFKLIILLIVYDLNFIQ